MIEPDAEPEPDADADLPPVADDGDDARSDGADAGDDDFGFGDGIEDKPLLMAASGGEDDEPEAESASAAVDPVADNPWTGSDPEDTEDPGAGADATADSADAAGSAKAAAPSDAGEVADDGDAEEGPVAAPKKKRRKRKARKARVDGENAPAAGAASDTDTAGADEATAEARPGAGVDAESRVGPAPARARGGRALKDGADRPGERSRRGSRRKSVGKPPSARSSRPRQTIDQLLRKGQEVVVQITKEGIGNKGPTLTTYVSLPGRCLVLMPSLPKCGVSRKIEDARERKRLKRIVRQLDETGHGGIGFIVRTAGINKSQQDLERDRDYLKKIWELVAQRLKVTRAPSLLYQESDLVLKAMRDQFTRDIADVVVDSEDVYMRIRDFAEKLMPHMAERIKQHTVTTPLFHHFGIEGEVEALYQPKIDLPNGASIVLDQTEALVAIDVNSGKNKAGQDSDDTAFRTNLDSISEIVRQLRLRDLGGLIIIDFIDMSHEKHRRGVERRIIDALRGDRARIKVGRISPFGMLEITRQRVGPGLKRTVFMQCPHCKGAGWSRTVQSKALSVLREVRALVQLKGYSILQVFVAPAVADYLVNHKRRATVEVEDAVGKSISFKPEPSYPIDVVHYRFMTGDGQEARVAIPAGLGVKA